MRINEIPSRVLLIETGSVLDQAIKNTVTNAPELQQVDVVAYGGDLAAFLEESLRAVPDVIVLSEARPVDWMLIPEILHTILADSLRLIVVRLNDNMLDVYDKYRIKVTRNEDLIAFIKKIR
jgi:hypothetical protein